VWISDRKTKKHLYFKGIHTIQLIASLLDMAATNADRRKSKNFQNSETVISIENVENNIKYTLDGVFDFMNFRHKDMAPQYKVLRVICDLLGWTKKNTETRHFFSC
jgi:hypothetical protein